MLVNTFTMCQHVTGDRSEAAWNHLTFVLSKTKVHVGLFGYFFLFNLNFESKLLLALILQ